MIALYLVNEEPTYIKMLSFSILMLRKHNPNLKVVVYFIKDGKTDSRKISLEEISFRLKNLPFDYDSFSLFCQENNIELRERFPIKESNSYYSLHRLVLEEVREETVLLLDGDTFIFGNIENLPQEYEGLDYVATPNTWGMHYPVPGLDVDFKSFNSGVVLCQNGIFSRWMGSIGQYCRDLYDGSHPLSKWLWSVSKDCAGREELSASLFVLDNKLKYDYFKAEHVQMGELKNNTLILHTLSPSWVSLYKQCFGSENKKPKLKLILKNNTNASS